MAISISGVSLPDLVIENEFAWTGVEAATERSLSGRPIIWEGEISGKPIDLIGSDKAAWMDRSTLIALRALAAVPNTTYDLIYGSDTYTVRFRHEEAPVIEATPIAPSPDAENTDRYNQVRIKLLEVTP